MNPFAEYIPKKFCLTLDRIVDESPEPHTCDSDIYIVDNVFRPEIKIEGGIDTIRATAVGYKSRLDLCSASDLMEWKGEITPSTLKFYQGQIGEKMLSVVMEEFVSQTRRKSGGNGITVAGEVLRENAKYRRKGYIAEFNDKYLLRFNRTTSFVLLMKTEERSRVGFFRQEKFGIQVSEIDGIGYMQIGGQNYLFVGEASTKDENELQLNSWTDLDKKGRKRINIEDRLFKPLQILFPDYKLIYFVMAPQRAILQNYQKGNGNKNTHNFDEINPLNQFRLRAKTNVIIERLSAINIETIFVPLPDTKPTIYGLAETLYKRIPLTRELLYAMENK